MRVQVDGTHVDDLEAAKADPDAPTHAAPAARDHVTRLMRNPVVLGFLLALLPGVAALGQALIDGEPAQGALSALWLAAMGYVTKLVRDRVTPLVDPRQDEGLPLVIDERALDGEDY